MRWAFALAFLLLTSIASAEPTAAEHFKLGQKLFAAGDYRKAAEEFESAYRLKPHHSPLWNAAQSWERAGEYVRAGNLYARFLRDAPADTPDRDAANASVRDLATKTGRIEVQAAGVTNLRLDGTPVDLSLVFVAPGDHFAEGDYEHGKVARKTVHVEAGQRVSVTVEPPPPPPPSPVIIVRNEDRGLKRLSPWWTAAGGFVTVGAGVLTIVSGLDSKSKKDAFVANRNATQRDLDDGQWTQTRTNLALGLTIGLAVATTVVAVIFTDWKGKKPAPPSPQVGDAK